DCGEPLARADFDGVRVDFAEWWVNVRKSNTEPYLRLVAEAADAESLAGRLKDLETVLAPFVNA
ncbi:MAG: phosphomannomutase/phosphoglucomutase, partial [Kiritimatiellae bacterium]|nr:phosphomannomutase/phosphoglucomutase [Kiritimatiellia bacterium]